VVEGLDFPMAAPNPKLRRELEEEARERGAEALHARLAEVDPEAGARIQVQDVKRVIRALEVYAETGKPISSLQAVDRPVRARYNTRQFGLTLPRAELYRRIEERVDGMVRAGLVDEVRALLGGGHGEGLVAMKGLGYAQLAPYVRGEIGLEEAVRGLKRDTRRFAKRQLTWFRADSRIEWVDVAEMGGSAKAAEFMCRQWEEG
jgi:tRNA dimethylallyltransferase